jgi:AbrB family looped-hinge helix DNA binding protein
MKSANAIETVTFSTRGQIVIPRRFRKEFGIEEGTRAVIEAEGDHLVLKPITSRFIRSLRGSLKDTRVWETFQEERKRERERA